MKGFVYQITHIKSGMTYIGSTEWGTLGVDYFTSSSNSGFRNDFKDHPEKYVTEVIEEVGDDTGNHSVERRELFHMLDRKIFSREIAINKRPSFFKGSGGFVLTLGIDLIAEYRWAVRKANKKSNALDETKAKISEALKGHEHTPESRAKMSESKKGNKNGVGNKNTLGRTGITDGISNRRIKPDESIPEGWRSGRTIRRNQITS